MRAVITGGSSGIGFATAQVLGREGYEIIVVSFDEKQQEPTLKALAEEGIKASYYLCDVTKEESVNETFAQISEKADIVYLLVNAVGGLGGRHEITDIVNFSTIAVTSGGGPGAAIYSASKGAVQSYTRGLAKDLVQFGIRVNAVSPGTIDTPFHAATARELVESWKAGIPMGRLGEASEVATVIKFLASPDASYITGEVIQINGGQAFI